MKFHSFGLKKPFFNEIPCNMYDVIFSSFINHLTKRFYEVPFTYLYVAGKNVTINFKFSILNKTKHLQICLENVEKMYEKLHKIFGYTAVVELYDGRTQTLTSFLS